MDTEHQPEHCFNEKIRVEELPGKGNGVVAVKDLPSDFCVAREEPIAWCIDPKYDGKVCTGCLSAEVGLKTCEQCGYGGCCLNCEEGDVMNHDTSECNAFMKINSSVQEQCTDGWRPADLILLCRMLVKFYRACDSSHSVWKLSSQDCSDGDKLQFRTTAASIASAAIDCNITDMQKLVVIIETNCYSLSLRVHYRPLTEGDDLISVDEDFNSVGIATYYSLSMFNHSCTPNIVKIPNGLSMTLVTVSPVLSNTEICHSYVSPQQSSSRRREELLHSWGFECLCERCTDATCMWSITNVCSCGGLYIRDPEDCSVGICHYCGEWADEL